MAGPALSFNPPEKTLRSVYQALLETYGPQHWWPGDSPLEICIGAILTQNTSWTNVEKAIANLKSAKALDENRLGTYSEEALAELIRPAGFFNLKARRLHNFLKLLETHGGIAGLGTASTAELRRKLLKVNGIGPETADSILLYAYDRPVFVIDAYTRRLFERLGLANGGESYETLRSGFENALGNDAVMFNEYHALIVAHGKHVCRRKPLCDRCALSVSICNSIPDEQVTFNSPAG